MLNLGATEIAVVGFVAVVILGPDRLPRAAAEAGKLLRRFRGMAQDAKAELRAELGPEVDTIRSLNPRQIVRDHLWADDLSPRGAAGPGAGAEPAPAGPPPWDAEAT